MELYPPPKERRSEEHPSAMASKNPVIVAWNGTLYVSVEGAADSVGVVEGTEVGMRLGVADGWILLIGADDVEGCNEIEGWELGTAVTSAPKRYFLAAFVAHFKLIGGKNGALSEIALG